MSPRERRSVSATSSNPRSSSRPLSACTSTPGLTPSARQRRAHRGDVGVEAQRELAHDRLLVRLVDAGQRRQQLAGVVRARQQQLAELDDPAASQPRQVDDAAERVERLRGADVRRGLLAADVLLARLQREHEAAPPVDVDGLAGDAPGHAAQVLLARGEEAERRPAEVQAVAQRLALADGHVDAAVAGRREHAERDRVDLRDDDRIAGVLRGGAQRGGVLDGAVEVRLGEDRRAGVGVDRRGPGIGVGDAVAQRHDIDVHVVAVRERAQRLDRVRVQSGAHHEALAGVVQLGQIAGGGDRRGALVDRCVGHRQRGQLADRGLVLEHHLQAALGDLGLVGRVRREELRALHQHVDRSPARSGRTCPRQGSSARPRPTRCARRARPGAHRPPARSGPQAGRARGRGARRRGSGARISPAPTTRRWRRASRRGPRA